MSRGFFLGALLALLSLGLLASSKSTTKSDELVREKYHVIQVEPFDLQQGVGVPVEFLSTLQPHLVQQLKDSHKFQEVLAGSDRPSQQHVPVLLLTGTVTGYDEGSRSRRYLGGQFGAGAARLFLTVKYLDRDSGELVYQEKVVGTLSGGVFGGNEDKVVDEVARSVTATTKLLLLRRLSDPLPAVGDTTTISGAALRDRQVFEIKSGEISAAEQKMNELASAGYRVSDLRTTGAKSAELTMDKTAAPPQTYQYVLPHALLIGNVQKNMNRLGAEGYRMVAHSVIFLGGYAAIMEKPPVPSETKYEYRLSVSLQQSNAEKHVAEDQQKGFVLVEAAQIQQQKVVVSEKTIATEEAAR